MKKITTILVIGLSALQLCADIAIGELAPSLKIRKFIKGSPIALTSTNNPKVRVIHLWKLDCKPCEALIAPLNNLNRMYGDKMEFVAISANSLDELNAAPIIKSMEYCVAADDMGKTISMLLPKDAKFPYAVIVGQNGRIYWHGQSISLSRIVPEILENRYNIAHAIDLEKFNSAMLKATTANDFKTALELIERRKENYPNDIFLDIAKSNIHSVQFKDPSKALEILDEAIAKNPKVYQGHEARLQLIMNNPKLANKLVDACQDFANNFTDTPMAIVQLSEILMRRPHSQINFMAIYALTHTAYTKGKFTSDIERGKAAAALAHCYYYVGMISEAIALSKEANGYFNGHESGKSSKIIYEFYVNAQKAAQEMKKDLSTTK